MNSKNQFTDRRARHIRDLLRILWQNQLGLSRAELARRLELSRPAISNITQQMLDWGLIEESEMTASGGGRPGTKIRIVGSAFQLLGLSLGSSHIQVLSMSLMGEIHDERRVALDCVNQPMESIEALKSLSQKVLKKGIPLLGVGVSAPCPVNHQQLNSKILPMWKGVNLRQTLQDYFCTPVFIDNDANLGALGELWWGHGQNLSSLLFVKMGTGIGAGIVNERQLIRGHHGFAGEIGHTFLRGDAQCRCGRKGCLEAVIGAAAIQNRLKNNSNVQQVMRFVARDLSNALISLLNVINPQGIILWGDILQKHPSFVSALQEEITSIPKWASINSDLIKVSSISSIIAMGAGTLVLEYALNNPSLFVQPTR
ncbi:MAG: ROK family transcriptional regulator [Myxococcota bacterium]|nr:ROK family transcriptional regulator [Myxococcota bacterium]